MNKDSIPLYSGYEDEEKSSNFYTVITKVIKFVIAAIVVFVIAFVAAWFTFVGTYYFTAKNEKPSNLMEESCFVQLPFHILKYLQRELSTKQIIEDDMFPAHYEVLAQIRQAYDQKAEKYAETFVQQANVRNGYYYPDPTFILSTVYFFSTLFAIVLRCIPFHRPGFIFTNREAKLVKVKQFLRAIVYVYVAMLYAIGIYKLVNVFSTDCSTYY
uniref:Uncharacterized protein n=1 Tax=Panagrolaimus sp. ES5 TaxID=591445 RepID=A0AC34FQB3_9BILA